MYVYVYMYACVCASTRTRVTMHTHTHTHAHIPKDPPGLFTGVCTALVGFAIPMLMVVGLALITIGEKASPDGGWRGVVWCSGWVVWCNVVQCVVGGVV
jgi:hypothetical protein